MDKGKVVVCKVGQVARYPPIDAVGVLIVCKVLVVSVDCDWEGGTEE